MCSFLKREHLDDADIGYSFLPDFRSRGYAYEATAALLDEKRRTLGLRRVVAITIAGNTASVRLLEKLGLSFERTVRDPVDGAECALYAADF